MRAEAVGGSAPSSLLRLACAPARSLPCSLFLPGRRRARLWSVAGGGTAWLPYSLVLPHSMDVCRQ